MNAFTPLESPESVVAILSKISFFGGATDAQQKELFQRLETATFRRGQYVVQSGDEPLHLYIVKSGSVEVLIPDPEHGVVIEKQRHGVGECFGHVALMSMHKHTISAVALEETEIIVLSRRALHQLHREDIELFALLMMNLAREMARLLRYTNAMLLAAWHPDGPGRSTPGTGLPAAPLPAEGSKAGAALAAGGPAVPLGFKNVVSE